MTTSTFKLTFYLASLIQSAINEKYSLFMLTNNQRCIFISCSRMSGDGNPADAFLQNNQQNNGNDQNAGGNQDAGNNQPVADAVEEKYILYGDEGNAGGVQDVPDEQDAGDNQSMIVPNGKDDDDDATEGMNSDDDQNGDSQEDEGTGVYNQDQTCEGETIEGNGSSEEAEKSGSSISDPFDFPMSSQREEGKLKKEVRFKLPKEDTVSSSSDDDDFRRQPLSAEILGKKRIRSLRSSTSDDDDDDEPLAPTTKMYKPEATGVDDQDQTTGVETIVGNGSSEEAEKFDFPMSSQRVEEGRIKLPKEDTASSSSDDADFCRQPLSVRIPKEDTASSSSGDADFCRQPLSVRIPKEDTASSSSDDANFCRQPLSVRIPKEDTASSSSDDADFSRQPLSAWILGVKLRKKADKPGKKRTRYPRQHRSTPDDDNDGDEPLGPAKKKPKPDDDDKD